MNTFRGVGILMVLVVMVAGCATLATPTSAPATTLVVPSPTVPAAPPTSTRSAPPPTLPPTVPPPTIEPTRTTAPPPAAPTPTVASTARPAGGIAPSGVPKTQWSETQRGLTAGMFFDPFPVQLGTQTNFGVVLTDAGGQPISDAAVNLTVTGGMEGMEGEHDEDFPLKLAHQGAGVYTIQASAGSSSLVITGMNLRIERGGQVWTFVIPKDALSSR